MLEDNADLIAAGGSIVFLRPNSKSPYQDDWTSLPRWTLDEARKSFPPRGNIGIRLGRPSKLGALFAHAIDVDIRVASDTAEAHAAFQQLTHKSLDDFPLAISGSGGESRHAYFVSDEAFPTRKLLHSDKAFIDSFGKHWNWEIDFGGTGRQFVLPPSIHPVTRQPYRWASGSAPDWHKLPFIWGEDIKGWQGLKPRRSIAPPTGDNLRDFVEQTRARPGHFTETEIKETLDTIADDPAAHAEWCEDREGWLKVGFALHHQYEGDEAGFEAWCAFSAESGKFDPDDSARVWQSMSNRRGAPSTTFKTLFAQARTVRASRKYGFSEAPPEHKDSALAEGPDDGENSIDALFTRALAKLEDDREREARAWQKELDRSDDDGIKATVPNIALIARRDPRLRGIIGLNDFTHEIVQRRPFLALTPAMFDLSLLDSMSGDLWTERHDINLQMFLATAPSGKGGGYGFNAPRAALTSAVVSASQHNRFHPIKDYLSRLRWDGRERVGTILIDYLGTPDTAYAREVARLMFVASVARIYEPGHKFDFAAILEGPQGKRKSTFIETLGVHWFGRLSADFGDRKKMVENMQGKWIVELPDLSGMTRSHVNDVKAFMSDGRDRVRLAYARRSDDYPRQTIFWGTSNDRHYLRDETGNRRFFPVPMRDQDIDTDRLSRNMPQVWAEARVLYRRLREAHPHGTLPLYLTDDASQDEALRLQADRKMESASEIEASRIAEWLDQPRTLADVTGDRSERFGADNGRYIKTRTCVAEVWQGLYGNPRLISNVETQLIQAALHGMPGWAGGARYRYSKDVGRQRSVIRIGAASHEVEKGFTAYVPN